MQTRPDFDLERALARRTLFAVLERPGTRALARRVLRLGAGARHVLDVDGVPTIAAVGAHSRYVIAADPAEALRVASAISEDPPARAAWRASDADEIADGALRILRGEGAAQALEIAQAVALACAPRDRADVAAALAWATEAWEEQDGGEAFVRFVARDEKTVARALALLDDDGPAFESLVELADAFRCALLAASADEAVRVAGMLAFLGAWSDREIALVLARRSERCEAAEQAYELDLVSARARQ